MDKKIQDELTQRFSKSQESLRGEFAKLRTGRASPAIFDGIRVDSYGTQMAMNQVATLSLPDSRTIVLTPWDKSLLPEIDRAIQKANIGLTPINDGKVVRINIPPLTEERRKDMVKVAKRITEESRVAVRNARREANEAAKKIQKDGKISEDDLKKWEADIQKLTDQAVSQVDSILAHKEKEIMEV